MSDMGRLAQLAMNPQAGASREEIYLAVASLYRVQGAGLNERERQLMREILRRLTLDVEMAIRIALAQRLADDTSAPHDLILLLVDDRIEVARPLILNSPLLTETDVLKMIAQCGIAHQEAVAERPHIGVPVTDALARSENESVLMALVRNVTARISDASYSSLVEKSRALTGLQVPLVRRPDMPPQLANAMCRLGLGRPEKPDHQQLPHDAHRLAVRAGRSDARMVKIPPPPPRDSLLPESAQKLIDKLAASGQLKTGFLMRVLSQGQMELFDLAFARLLEIDVAGFRTLFYNGGARNVALACRATGIDRAVFATVYNLSRQARGLNMALTPVDFQLVDSIFATVHRQSALEELRGAPH